MPEFSNSDLLEHLNEPQRKAVTHGEGPLLVLAGPGSGKTTVIVRRIQYLISEMHVPPEQILVITFTKDAAKAMQQRFWQRSGRCVPVNFGTFHSVFYHILRQSSQVFRNVSDEGRLLTENAKRNLILPVMKKIIQREKKYCLSDNLAADAAELLSGISYYKNVGDTDTVLSRLSREWRDYFEEVFSEYQRAVRHKGALDFDDMVFECRRLLEQDAGQRNIWQNRFDHILIDEFQDINPQQYRVVRLLAKEPFRVFAVGDDDQAIYGFRGADPACLKQFEEDYQAETVILNLNYRSERAIVETSTKVIACNRERFAKKLRAASEAEVHENSVQVVPFRVREEQNAYLREQIKDFTREHPDGDCAVLFRTNVYMQSFAAGLSKAGIEYVMREKGKNPYEHFVARDIMTYLRFAAGDRRREIFLAIMNKPSRYLRREALAGMERVDLERLKDWYREYGGARRPDHLDAIEQFGLQMRTLAGMPLKLAVQYICKAVGYEGYLRAQAAGKREALLQEWLMLLDWLKEDAAGYDSLEEWLAAQKEYGREGEEDIRNAGSGAAGGKERGARGAVQLMTVHAAKGLEFERVWIPDCNEKVFPHGNMPDAKCVEEERRIFYVGMTRAKKRLELLYLTGTGERPRVMSRFLEPVADGHSSISSSNSQVSRYSSKASATFSYSSSSSM